MWKTKQIKRGNGTSAKLMICQNSKPELSKWADFAPEDAVCKNWSEVNNKSVSSLCWECTARSVNADSFR